jgi:hypothetical protein
VTHFRVVPVFSLAKDSFPVGHKHQETPPSDIFANNRHFVLFSHTLPRGGASMLPVLARLAISKNENIEILFSWFSRTQCIGTQKMYQIKYSVAFQPASHVDRLSVLLAT